MNDVKDYRKDELKYYVIANVLLILFIHGYFPPILDIIKTQTKSTLMDIVKVALSTGIISSVIYAYIFVIDAIIPAPLKLKFCNLWRNLPGETIFDDLRLGKINDTRFTTDEVQNKYSEVYEQLQGLSSYEKRHKANSIWYRIFQKHIKKVTVLITYRDCLLCRDLYIASLLLLLLYPFLCCIRLLNFNCKYLLILIFEIIVTNIAMRVKQNRLVRNVIAIDIHHFQGNVMNQFKEREDTVKLTDLDEKTQVNELYKIVDAQGYSKKDFYIFVCIIFIINLTLISVWLFTTRSDKQFVAHFAFASTVTSIILSVLAIFMSISGELKTQNLRDSIEQEAEHIFRVTEELKMQTMKLSNQVDMVQSTTENIKFSLNTSPVIPSVATGDSGKKNSTQFDKGQE